MGERLVDVHDVLATFPWADQRRGKAKPAPRAGFSFAAWDGNVVVSSWSYVRRHIVHRHDQQAWSDFLHATASPCLVLDQRRRWPPVPRLALYRVRPGLENTFRLAVLEQHAPGRLSLVTAYPKKSLAGDHYRALTDGLLSSCGAYCLRRRDLQPMAGPPPRRWSVPSVDLPAGCCELEPGC